jgi:hypothetical protein
MRHDNVLMAALLLTAGCGGDGQSVNGSETASGGDPGSSPAAQTVAAAATAEPDVECGSVKGQSAPQGQPADDILGVRHGMTLGQVRNVLQCKNPSYAINSNNSSIGLPSGGQMSRINLTADTGLDRVNVWLVGPSGREQVIHVERMMEYTEGKQLPVASIKQELASKYGKFDDASYGHNGAIVRSRDGQQLTPQNSNYGICSQQNFQTSSAVPCLNVVSYHVQPDNRNPDLAARFTVAVTNHARGAAMVEAAEQQKSADVERARKTVADEGLDL